LSAGRARSGTKLSAPTLPGTAPSTTPSCSAPRTARPAASALSLSRTRPARPPRWRAGAARPWAAAPWS
jgi:hypothetical protein